MSLVIYFACFTFIAAARVSSETLEPRRIESNADDDNWIQDVRFFVFRIFLRQMVNLVMSPS